MGSKLRQTRVRGQLSRADGSSNSIGPTAGPKLPGPWGGHGVGQPDPIIAAGKLHLVPGVQAAGGDSVPGLEKPFRSRQAVIPSEERMMPAQPYHQTSLRRILLQPTAQKAILTEDARRELSWMDGLSPWGSWRSRSPRLRNAPKSWPAPRVPRRRPGTLQWRRPGRVKSTRRCSLPEADARPERPRGCSRTDA